MPTWAWIVIIVVAALIVLGAVAAWARQRKTSHLQERFGSEYDRTVSERGERGAAETELTERERKRERLDIVPLSPEAQERYAASWREVQSHFVDDPPAAMKEADGLVTQVMRERGYPIDDFEQRAADISVDHPDVVEHYRAAHAVHVKEGDGGDGNGVGTEDLRQGLVHYRALFDELLETRERTPQEAQS